MQDFLLFDVNKNRSLTLKHKIDILQKAKTCKKSCLAKEYGVNVVTIYRICKNHAFLLKEFAKNTNSSIQRFRKSKYVKTEQAMIKWFSYKKAKNSIINGSILLEKAQFFSKQFNEGIPDASWLQRFRARQNITLNKSSTKLGCTKITEAKSWMQEVLPLLIESYPRERIYTCGEAGLFYKSLPSANMGFFKQELGIKGRHNRITLLFIVNGDGSKKQVYVIGKNENPSCFKNVSIPIKYYHNEKAWMTQDIFTNILEKWDNTLEEDVLLMCDNSICHKTKWKFRHIKLEFFPYNTSPLIQPLNMGIIRVFKSMYRKNVLQKMKIFLDGNGCNFGKHFNLLDSLYMIKHCWQELPITTISACFVKAGFFKTPIDIIKPSDLELDITNNNLLKYIIQDDYLCCHGDVDDDKIIGEIENPNFEEKEEIVRVEDMPSENDALCAYHIFVKYALSVLPNQDKFRDIQFYIESNIFPEKPTQRLISNEYSMN